MELYQLIGMPARVFDRIWRNMARKLLFSVSIKDCRVDTFTVGGHGGAGKDTSNTGVRVTHEPSGAVGRSVDTRSQSKNKQLAFRRMGESTLFKAWAKLKASGVNGHSIEEQVDEAMTEKNLKIEVKDDKGEWTNE